MVGNGHAFCENCLEVLAKNHASGESISCPLCWIDWVLMAEKAKALQNSFKVDRLVFCRGLST